MPAPPSSPRAPGAGPILRKLLTGLLVVLLVAGFAGVDSNPAVRRLLLAPSTTATAAADAAPAAEASTAEGGPAPIHGYTCVYSKDFRLVLLDPSSPVYVGGTVRHLNAPLARLTLLFSDGMQKDEEALAAGGFERVCGSLVRDGHVASCRTARIADVAEAALGHFGLAAEDFGTPQQWRRSACPLVSTYLEVTGGGAGGGGGAAGGAGGGRVRGPGAPRPPPQSSLVLFWEGDVSLARPSTWLRDAAAFAGAAPAEHVVSNPCWRLRDPGRECLSEVDGGAAAAAPAPGPPPPDPWRPFKRVGFSQQVFAVSSASLRTVDWRQAAELPDGRCGRFPDALSYEHRACRWMSANGWRRFLHDGAAYVHTGLDAGALRELGNLLREQGWPHEG